MLEHLYRNLLMAIRPIPLMRLSVNAMRLSVNAMSLSVNAECLSVNAMSLSVNAMSLSVNAMGLSVNAEERSAKHSFVYKAFSNNNLTKGGDKTC